MMQHDQNTATITDRKFPLQLDCGLMIATQKPSAALNARVLPASSLLYTNGIIHKGFRFDVVTSVYRDTTFVQYTAAWPCRILTSPGGDRQHTDFEDTFVMYCQNCRAQNDEGARFCIHCGTNLIPEIQPRTDPIKTEVQREVIETKRSNTVYLDCSACRSSKSMPATTIPRFTPILRVIGGIIVVPSFLGLAFAGLILISTLMATGNVASAATDAGAAGAAIGLGIGFGLAVFIGAISLVSGLVGWLLLMTRKVFKCSRCGFVLDRA